LIKNNINLGFLLPDMGIGGVETQVAILVNELSKNSRYKVSLIIISKNLKHQISDRVNVFHVKAEQGIFNKLRKFIPVLKFIKQQKIEYLHGFLGRGMEWTSLLSFFLSNCKNIICFRSNLGFPNYKTIVWNRVIFSNVYAVTTNNKYVEKHLPSRLGFKSNLVQYIPNGIDINSVCSETIYPNNTHNFITPASLNDRKNQLLIIEVLEKLNGDMVENLKFNFYGKGDPNYLAMLTGRINISGLSSLISINKTIQTNLYDTVDALILPSFNEGFPNVLLEAMKYGKLILISKQAEQNNVIKDGYNGILFDAYDPNSLKTAILKSISLTPEEIKSMCAINSNLIKEKYSIKKVTKLWEDLYS